MTSRVLIPFEKYRLDNGLTVILHEDHRLPLCAVNLWYHVGAKDEPRGRSGFAHLFEHLMFMGTHRAPRGEFDRIMESGGGANNATTSADRTNYFSWGPQSLLPTLLWLEADRLEHLGHAMTQEKLDLQRAVVRNERRQSYENEPYGMADLAVDGLMYPDGHPYQIPVIGTHEDLVAATVQDVKDFFATYYCPNNGTLVVAGDFDPASTKKMIADWFGTLPRRADPTHRTASPVRLPAPKFQVMHDPHVEFSRVSFIWHSPPGFAPGDAECDLLAKILTDGLTSRLHKRLIYDETLAQSVSAYQQSQQLGSMFRIDVVAQDDVALERIEAAVDAELDRIRTDGPTEPELTRVQNQLETEAVVALQRLLERADRLNFYDAQLGDPNGFDRDFQRYRDATPATVRDWARQVLDPSLRLRLHVHPRDEISSNGDADVTETEAMEAAIAEPEWTPAIATPRDRRPSDLPAAPFAPATPTGFRIATGVWCLLHERHDLPLVRILFRFDGGALHDPPEKAGLADLTAQLLREGAKDLRALDFSFAVDRLGASFDTGADHDSVLAQLIVLSSNLKPALALALDALESPRFDEDAFRRIKTQALGALKQRSEQPGLVARVVSNAAVCGEGHPIGRPTDGHPSTLAALTLDDVKAFWKAQVCRRIQVLVAGEITKGDVLDLMKVRMSAFPAVDDDENSAGTAPVARAESMRVLLVDRPGAPQTVIRFVWPGIAHRDEDRLALALATTVFGGSFTSRLNQNLREAHGYTYGARAGIEYHPGAEDPRNGPSLLSSSSSVHAQVTGASVREFLAEFARMRLGDISGDEVEKARSTLRNIRVHASESLDGLVSELDGLVTFDLPLDHQVHDLARLEGVTVEQVNAVARRVLHPSGGVLVLVGDAAQIEPQLAGMDLPKPQRAELP